MPYYKIEINVELEDEQEAQVVEGECYTIVKNHVDNYNKITMDMVYEIKNPDE